MTSKTGGGVFFLYRYRVVNTPNTVLTLLPSIYLQRIARNDFDLFNANSYGVGIELGHRFTSQTRVRGYGFLSTLDPNEWLATSRAGLELFHNINAQNLLTVSAIYRQRIFNRSLGEQNLTSSFGVTLSSAGIPLNKGLTLSYLLGGEYVTAGSDDPMLPLGRFQTAANLNWVMPIWRGTPYHLREPKAYATAPVPYNPSCSSTQTLGG